MPSKRLALAVVLACLPACLLLTDLDGLGHPLAPTDAAIEATAGDGAIDAGCDATICEDFDHGTGNPLLVFPPPSPPSGLTIEITSDVSASPPSSLRASLLAVDSAHEDAFLVASPPTAGSGMTVSFAFRPLSTDYVIFAYFECTTANGYGGLVLYLAPDGTIQLAHGYDGDRTDIGTVGTDAFTTIAVRFTRTATSLKGATRIGRSAETPFDRPVGCSGDGQRVRLGIEGAGGRAAVAFDDLVYDVLP